MVMTSLAGVAAVAPAIMASYVCLPYWPFAASSNAPKSLIFTSTVSGMLIYEY